MRPFDANGNFRPLVNDGGLRRAAVRSAGVTVFAQSVGFAVQMIATIALARLLAPSDFGVVAMVTTFSVLLVSFGQIGFPEAVLQREEMNYFLASNLFWINLSAGLLLTIGFAAAGSLLARFYHDPRVAHVAVGVSLTIFITSASVLHLALLKRAMRFSAVSLNDILARAASVFISILLAILGWGYWALVGGAVAQTISMSVGAWILCRWVPSLPRRAAGTSSLMRFAVTVNGRWNFDYFARNMDNLLVGWQFGSAPLGFYKKAYDLFALPANQLLSVYPVAVSTLSRLNRNPVQYRRYFLSGLSVLAFVGMAIGADLTLVGRDLVRLVLGPGWETSGQIFSFFGPGIGLMLIYGSHGIIHLSIGTTGRYFRWGIVEFIVTGLLFLLALPWGPLGIAAAWTFSFWILTIPAFWYAGKPIQFGIAPVLGVIWRYLLASVLAGFACAAIVRHIPSVATASDLTGAATRLLTTSIFFTALYIIAVVLLHRGFVPLYQFAGLLREMAPCSRGSARAPVISAIPSLEKMD